MADMTMEASAANSRRRKAKRPPWLSRTLLVGGGVIVFYVIYMGLILSIHRTSHTSYGERPSHMKLESFTELRPIQNSAASSRVISPKTKKRHVQPTGGETTTKVVPTTKKQQLPSSAAKQLDIPQVSANSTLPAPHEHALVKKVLQETTGRSMLPLMAVLESPLPEKKPLPIRRDSSLTTVSYPEHIQSCHDIPNNWPVGHPKALDEKYGSNFGRSMRSIYPVRHEYAQTTCPVDADPFLPWIHDIFVDASGQNLQIIAHNKRRCHRFPKHFGNDIANLEPQVALMQSVPIQQMDGGNRNESSATWERLYEDLPSSWKTSNRSNKEHWYRLAPLEDADIQSQETRFLCQFFTLRPVHEVNEKVQRLEKVIVGETWSTYPYNYEHANYQHRRGQQAKPMLTRPVDRNDVNGIHNEQVWNAMLDIKCPLPTEIQRFPNSSIDLPTFYVDLVPVRTPPRETLTGYSLPLIKMEKEVGFDPAAEWGDRHILPPVSQSGRWANIPICPASIKIPHKNVYKSIQQPTVAQINSTISSKPFYMVGCIWASAVFSERGKKGWDTNTLERMLEWLTYHLEIAGFDHMVVYDNTEAHTNTISLESVTSMFPGRVTRQPWKHRICNNNGYGDPDAGERSSQYAAEASCRARYGPMTEWMAFFDTDEYFIPSANWSSIRDMLQVGVANGTIGPETNILSFYETKAALNYRFTERYTDTVDCKASCTTCDCRKKLPNATYLEAYCEPFPFPRKFPETKTKMKQIYRPSFVLNHFVHYAAVTDLVNTRPKFPRVVGYPIERRAKEFTEGYMLHTKTRSPAKTKGWNSTDVCNSSPYKCGMGLPYPYYQFSRAINTTFADLPTDEQGRALTDFGIPFNCYELQKVQEDLASRLHVHLDPSKEKWANTHRSR